MSAHFLSVRREIRQMQPQKKTDFLIVKFFFLMKVQRLLDAYY